MSTFADLLVEFGNTFAERVDYRAGAWTTALESPGWRFRLSRPAKNVDVVHEVRAGKWTVWAIGEIHSYRARPSATTVCTERFVDDLASGCAAAESLSGRFLLAAWSMKSNTWNFWTDRSGGVHAYMAGVEGRTAIGTYSPAVYEYSARKLDWIALTGFFSLGFFPGDRTYYEDCRVLRPGCRYEFSERGRLLRCSQYWRWTHHPEAQRTEDDTIAEFGETLACATRHQSNHGRVALPLSGGLDSRTLAACVRGRSDIHSFSYGYTDESVESDLAGQVARAAGLPFQRHTIRPYLFEQLQLQLEAVEGFQDVTQTRQAGVVEWLNGRAEYVLGGHWGDVLCDDMKVPAKATAGQTLDHLVSKMKKRGGECVVQNISRQYLGGEDTGQIIRQVLKEELDQFAHIEDSDFRVKVVKTAQWAFRWTLPSIRMYQPAAVPRLPFLDSRMLDFFCTVPTKAVLGRRLQIEYLKRFAPDLARVRWQDYDADLFHYQHFSTWQIPRRAWKKIKRTVSRNPVLKRNWEVQFGGQARRAQLEQHLLRSGLILHELVPREQLQALLNDFYARPDASNGYAVSMLLTFSTWAERFHR